MATSVMAVRLPRQWAEELRLLALTEGVLVNDVLKSAVERTLETIPAVERDLLSRLAAALEREREG